MKNPRLLLTAFLTCCMTAAPQNAAAQSPMRTSSSVPPQVELMYVKGLRYLQNAQKTDGTYDGTYGEGSLASSVLPYVRAGSRRRSERGAVRHHGAPLRRLHPVQAEQRYPATLGIPCTTTASPLALAEAYGMVRDDRIGPALRKAVALTLTAQKKTKREAGAIPRNPRTRTAR